MVAAYRAPTPAADRFSLFTTMRTFHGFDFPPDDVEMRLLKSIH
jgi:hypothetical protein